MKTGKKSIEQYIFRSNALMVLVVLGLFLIVNAMVFALYGSNVRDDTAEDLEVAEGAFDASMYLDMWIEDGMDQDSESLLKLGKTHMYVGDGFTCITLETEDQSLRGYVVSGEYEDFMTTLKETAIWISYYTLNAALFIVILFVTCSLSTRQLIRHIMVPLNILNQASAEMKKGDYTHPVSYEGDSEFESACSSFEEMRAEIQRTEQEKADYEKERMIISPSPSIRRSWWRESARISASMSAARCQALKAGRMTL